MVVLFILVLFILVSFELFIGFLIILLLVYLRNKVLLGDDYMINIIINNSYECGFEYGFGRCGFSLQFYVIRFSFLLFDLEICLFTPTVLGFLISGLGFKLALFFLVMLFAVFLYEVSLGAFNWF